jgi:hypothetical protein
MRIAHCLSRPPRHQPPASPFCVLYLCPACNGTHCTALCPPRAIGALLRTISTPLPATASMYIPLTPFAHSFTHSTRSTHTSHALTQSTRSTRSPNPFARLVRLVRLVRPTRSLDSFDSFDSFAPPVHSTRSSRSTPTRSLDSIVSIVSIVSLAPPARPTRSLHSFVGLRPPRSLRSSQCTTTSWRPSRGRTTARRR